MVMTDKETGISTGIESLDRQPLSQLPHMALQSSTVGRSIN